MSANSRIRFGMQIVFVCLFITPSHYHHCANLSEDIELIKCLSSYILSSVWVRLNIFSQLSIVHYMGLCVFSLHISLVMTERIYTLSYYHYQIGSMNCHPMFRVRSWNNGLYVSLYSYKTFLHTKPWIPGGEGSIFTAVIHWLWRHNDSTPRSRDVTNQLGGRHNAKSEETVLSDNGEISDR